ncbi:hypothetical protein LG52_581 [Geobacillus kaustophilus]|uniref:Uncharacterized protein n=1 Tax=Geobacillus kaustophilus TaxID=1462 RepID=A0A0D8BUF4_GEOKU|nr:hypothetical protein [Geobacillus kaustophilus]KJE27745.1 hypothetical protein LG52_581 [Geobacillus kaustophilus]
MKRLLSIVILSSTLCLPLATHADYPKQITSTHSNHSYSTISIENAKKAIENFIERNELLHDLKNGKIEFQPYTGDLHIAYKDPDNGANNTATHWFDWTDDDQDIDFAWLS